MDQTQVIGRGLKKITVILHADDHAELLTVLGALVEILAIHSST